MSPQRLARRDATTRGMRQAIRVAMLGWSRGLVGRALVVSATLLSACGGSDGPTGPPVVASVSILRIPGTFTAIGESTEMTATPKDALGRDIAGSGASWASSDPAVATVSNGLVTATGNGTATITATIGTVSGSTQVTVEQRLVQVVLTSSSDTISAIGDTVRATASGRDPRGNPMAGVVAVWSSADPSVLTVDGSGLVTALAPGVASVRATAGSVVGERLLVVQQRAARLVILQQPPTARAGLPISTPPWVELQDARGVAIAGDNSTAVTAAVLGDDAGIVSGATVTATGGVARFTSLLLGGTAGEKVLQFSAPGTASAVSAPVTLTGGAGTRLVTAAGDGQFALAGSPLVSPLRAGVRDAWGNPVSGTPVQFAVISGSGSVATSSATTAEDGNASMGFTLSRYAGTAVVRATATSVPGGFADFSVVATPNGTIRGTITVTGSPAPLVRAAGAAGRSSRGEPPVRTDARAASLAGVRLPALPRATNKQRSSDGAVGIAARNGTVGSGPAATSSNVTAASVSSPAVDAHVPGELLVTYRPSALSAPNLGAAAYREVNTAQSLAGAMQAVLTEPALAGLVSTMAVSPSILTARVQLREGVSEDAAVAELRRDPRVASVERNTLQYSHRVEPTELQAYLHRTTARSSRSLVPLVAPRFASTFAATFPSPGLYPTDARYVEQAWHYNLLGLPRAWQQTQGSPDVIVAVIDDGIRFDHPAMFGVLTDDGHDFVSSFTAPLCGGGSIVSTGDGDGYDSDPTVPSRRSYSSQGNCVSGISNNGGHGLHVAGTIGAARGNSTGLVGVNWNVRIRPVRALGVFGSGTAYDISQAILYAAGLAADDGDGGFVVAADGPARVINMSLGGSSPNAAQRLAVEQAALNGVLLVASAGNSGSPTPNYPASYTGVLSVSAVAPTMALATYSSYGASVDIAAPGGQTSSGDGHGVFSTTWDFTTGTPTFDSWQGTSMAAPHVSGVAALTMARHPGLSATQVRQRLTSTAIDLGAPGSDVFFGAGLVNARNALAGTSAPNRALYARLVHAPTGLVVRTVAVDAGGQYEFAELPDGEYWVFAGADEDGDRVIGPAGRVWGAAGSASNPSVLVIDGAGVYQGTFTLTSPSEIEPNNTPSQADLLLVGGHINGAISSANDIDHFRLRIPQAGVYSVLVTGRTGACGFALETDPLVGVANLQGVLLATNDDLDASARDYCAGVTLPLAPGDYIVLVEGYASGRYVVQAARTQ